MSDSKECVACLTRMDDVRDVKMECEKGPQPSSMGCWPLCYSCRIKLTHAIWDVVWEWRDKAIKDKEERLRMER